MSHGIDFPTANNCPMVFSPFGTETLSRK